MSSFIVFIVIAIAWAVFGSLKAAVDKVGKDATPPKVGPSPLVRNNERKAPMPTKQVESHSGGLMDSPMELSVLRAEEVKADFGDRPPVYSSRPKPMMESIKQTKQQPHPLEPLFEGKRLAEAIILAEVLDKPRAYRPHPINKNFNTQKGRG